MVNDNVANTLFTSQKKLSAKRARWQEFLADFNFDWLHRLGRYNVLENTLSRKEVIVYIVALSEVVLDFNEMIKRIVDSNVSYEKLRQ